jgi:ribonuclease HII
MNSEKKVEKELEIVESMEKGKGTGTSTGTEKDTGKDNKKDNDKENVKEKGKKTKGKVKKETVPLLPFYNDKNQYEIALDEAGRGCLFGRVYIGCVVLPKDLSKFAGVDIKDSKKFTSKKKIGEVADFIKTNALAWHVSWVPENIIDDINILQSVMRGMHEGIRECLVKLIKVDGTDQRLRLDQCMALVDGSYFVPYTCFDEASESIRELSHVTVEQGDGKYMAIAAASILAKTSRDAYVEELCAANPVLVERYGLDTNMGYGTKRHLDGIREFGVCQWHRKTFGEHCKNAVVNMV